MRKLFFLLIAICGVMFTGCAQLIDLNEKESDVLAEYMASTMLRYDKNYDEALIYPEETAETADSVKTGSDTDTKPDNTTEQTGDDNASVTPDTSGDSQYGAVASLAGMFKDILKDNFSISYEAYKSYDSYPDEDQLFTIEASKGKKLLVFNFNVKNITDKNKKLDLMNYSIAYQLTDNKSIVYYPMMTLLNNDIQYINLGIAAGTTKKAVVLFEVPKDIDMSDMLLALTYKDKTTFLDIDQ